MTHALLLTALLVLATQITRAAPFLLLPKGRPLPPVLDYLGRVLPSAVMALLVVYCFKDVAFAAPPHGAPELICVAAVAALHCWRRSTLLSVAGGTILYMVLVQTVFA